MSSFGYRGCLDDGVGNFPISIDYGTSRARPYPPMSAKRADELLRLQPQRKLILGVDRLDYTKGIPHRLQAFARLLDRHPELRERISLIQVVVPSRVDIPQYFELKSQIERLVGRINGTFMRPGGWVPVWYGTAASRGNDLLAVLSCRAHRARHAVEGRHEPRRQGILRMQYRGRLRADPEPSSRVPPRNCIAARCSVNPYDTDGVADAIYHAYTMGDDERRNRMRRMRRSVRECDIFWWVDTYLQAAIERDLSDYPQPENYVPEVSADYVPI